MSDKTIALVSFSFRHGLPVEADMVVDARFLKNPFYEASLSSLSGLDKEAGDYIESDPEFARFFERLVALVLPLFPRYLKDKKDVFTLAVGCTGGQHRSVYVVKKMGEYLHGKGYKVTAKHRDLKI
jgi:UPF0042 nucleotide-binding protein